MKWMTQICVLLVAGLLHFEAVAGATSTLPFGRIVLFNDYTNTTVWTHDSTPPPSTLTDAWKALLTGTNHQYAGWSFRHCRTGCGGYVGLMVPPKVPVSAPSDPYTISNLAANLQNTTNAVIESPVFTNGIGTIYFDAINGNTPYTNTLSVSIATRMTNTATGVECEIPESPTTSTNGFSFVWQTIDSLSLSATAIGGFTNYAYALNYRGPVKLLINRTDYSSVAANLDRNYLVIDNLRVSLPPADVVLSKEAVPFTPPYPSTGTNITIRCEVSNVDLGLLTDSRTVSVVYRWRYPGQSGVVWNTNAMSYVVGSGDGSANGNGAVFEATLPSFSDVGDVEYYFQCTFDGDYYVSPDYTSSGRTYPSESNSFRVLRSTEEREFYTRLRFYTSDYGALYAETDQSESPVAMSLVGTDAWRAMVPIRSAAGSLTNLTWRFRGDGKYTEATRSISSDPVYWVGLDGVDPGVAPYGGMCQAVSDGSARLSVGIESGAYAMLTFNTRTLQYIASHAEYQNFNDWQAPTNVFTESGAQVPQQSFLNTFSDWPLSVEGVVYDDFLRPPTTNVYSRNAFQTVGFWWAGSAGYVSERPFDVSPGSYSTDHNSALRLKGGDSALGLGYVFFNPNELVLDGVKAFTYKSRLGQTSDNYDIVLRTDAYTKTNYTVRAIARVVSTNALSPENPSISLIAYYKSPQKFYEFRAVQVKDPNATFAADSDRAINCQLYKWTNGVATLLQQTTKTYTEAPLISSIAEGYPMEIRVANTTATSTRIRCKYGINDNVIDFTDSTSPLRSGTYGFLSSECGSSLSHVTILDTDSTATSISGTSVEALTSSTIATDVQSWDFPSDRYQVGSDAIYSIIPSQKIELSVSEDGSTWSVVKTNTVANFAYQTDSYTFNSWKSLYVKLQMEGGAADVAVDDLYLYSWHGQTVQQDGWKGTEVWVDVRSGLTGKTPGLYEGRISSYFSLSTPNPATSIQLTTRYANTTNGWANTTTYVYSGSIYLDGSTYVFGERFDDAVQLKIDGQVILYDTSYNTTTTNTLTLSEGWYDFELRVGQNTGSAGPNGTGVFNSGYGVAYRKSTGASWLPLTDYGSGSFLVAESASSLNKMVDLNLERANPSIAQGVRSLKLTNGLGSVEFDYQVVRPPAKIAIQYVYSSSTDPGASLWQDVSSFVVTNVVSDWTHLFVYWGAAFRDEAGDPGYFRIVNVYDEEAGYTNGWVSLDNVKVWDSPYVDETSWRAYNAKITDTELTRVSLDESKAAYLNNSSTTDTDPIQNQHIPFIQSPFLTNGVGTVSFYARPYLTNQIAAVYVYASTNGVNAPDSLWFLAKSFVGINNQYYRPFTYTFAGDLLKSVDAVRLTTDNGVDSPIRVCLEEVAVSEPVLPGFDISNVRLMLDQGTDGYVEQTQPLAGEELAVEARIVNQRLYPSNITMYVSYYVGTNTWGWERYLSAPTTVTRRMMPVSTDENETLYRTVPRGSVIAGESESKIGGILGQDSDVVVQYYVWATYRGDDGTQLEQVQKTFTNPSWYYPINLNTRYAAQGWSPYYIVYNVRPHAVWINEINRTDITTGIGANQYIEIAVPAWMSLAGWSVDVVQKDSYEVTTIPFPSTVAQPAAVTNGYAFFVIADVTTPSGATAITAQYRVLGTYGVTLPKYRGGLRLKRPLGMYEQAIAYDYDPTYGATFDAQIWADGDPEGQFVYIGREIENGSLSRIGAVNYDAADSTNTWAFPKYWTPGAPNTGQDFSSVDGDRLQPGVSNLWVVSTLSQLKGTQNDKRVQTYSVRLRIGDSTNIVYSMDDWYRVYSLTMNSVEQMSLSDRTQGLQTFDLSLPDLTNDVSIVATIGYTRLLDGYTGNTTILDWIMSFTEGPIVPSYYLESKDGVPTASRELTIEELYWLNADPTKTNYLDFAIAGPSQPPTGESNLVVNLQLNLRTEMPTGEVTNKVSSLQGGAVLKLLARADLTSTDWRMVRQFSINDASFDATGFCRVVIPNPYAVLLAGWNPNTLFLKWLIEKQDVRAEVLVLTNTPE